MTALSALRELLPHRALTWQEAMSVAERQALRLLKLSGVSGAPIPENVVSSLPRVRVERLSPIPVSGSTHWTAGCWLIMLNGAEPLVRQRFSLAHEFKHVVDHPLIDRLYPSTLGVSSQDRAEQICDYFAACLLMPRPCVKRAYCDDGVQNLHRLARRFGVSPMAMQVRLLQLGLMDPPPRCGPLYRRLLPVSI